MNDQYLTGPGSPAATDLSSRILGYDLARALALLGMIVVHFGLVASADHSRPAWAALVLRAFDGRAASTFMVLAGIGLTLRSRRVSARDEPPARSEVRKTLIRRGVFLLTLGFMNLVIWPGDILRVYGVSMLVAAGLITVSNRNLLLISCGFAVVFIALFLTTEYGMNWDWTTMTYNRLWEPKNVVRNLFFDGFRSVFPWTGVLVFGMWLGRRELRERATNTRFLIGAGLTVLAAEFVSALCVSYFRANPQTMDLATAKALFGTESMPPLPLFLASGVGAAVFVIVLCVRVAETFPDAVWLRPLVAMGQMALTWYFAHIIIGLGAIEALHLEASRPLPVAEGFGLIFFALAVVLSWVWKQWFRHGPLEWLMRIVAG